MYNKVFIGIDQSYADSGMSVAIDGKLKIIRSIKLCRLKNNSERRRALAKQLDGLLSTVVPKSDEVVCIIERIRLQSQGFVNIDYIKSIGALNCVIVDKCHEYGVKVYSVDTRCWKAQVVGSSKKSNNKWGVPEEKWLTIRWLLKQGWESSIIEEQSNRVRKNIFIRDGKKYKYNDNAADSAGIAMFGFVGDPDKLEEEN